MNENNNATKWLQYLMYMGIAALVNSIIAYVPLVGSLNRWIGIAISAAIVYLLFRLKDANPRYRNAAIFSAVALVCAQIGGAALILACTVCGTIAQYQEYHGHSDLIRERDPKLADKWNSLFWLQFAGSLLLGAVVALFGVTLVMISGEETELTTTLTSILSVLLSLVLKALYLMYLHRTIKVLKTEAVE